MTQTKHTPGPWGIQEGKTLLHIETFESERGDGSLDTRTPICSVPKKSEANARLIAAAPDLLGASKSALHLLEYEQNEGTKFSSHINVELKELREAIAKAEGGA